MAAVSEGPVVPQQPVVLLLVVVVVEHISIGHRILTSWPHRWCHQPVPTTVKRRLTVNVRNYKKIKILFRLLLPLRVLRNFLHVCNVLCCALCLNLLLLLLNWLRFNYEALTQLLIHLFPAACLQRLLLLLLHFLLPSFLPFFFSLMPTVTKNNRKRSLMWRRMHQPPMQQSRATILNNKNKLNCFFSSIFF